MNASRLSWRALAEPRLFPLLAAALAVLTYLGAVGHEFVFDDVPVILENTRIHDLSNLPRVLLDSYWGGVYGNALGIWRPLATALYAIQWAVWDGNPVGYNVVLILLHGAATYLVTLLAMELTRPGLALLAGVIFAVHPVHVEAVANVVGTAEVLSTALVLVAALLHVRGGRAYGAGRSLAIAALYGLAFLTKEGAITFLALVFVLDALREDVGFRDLPDYLRRRWLTYALLVAVALALLAARSAVLGSVASAVHPLGGAILKEVPRIWTVITTWPLQVSLLVFPLDLTGDYSPRVIPIRFGPTLQGMVGVAVVLAFLILSWVLWRRARREGDRDRILEMRALAFGVLWVVIALSPVSNVLFLSGILLAERTFYLPSVGFAITAAVLLGLLVRERRQVGWALLVAWVSFLGVRSVLRVPAWESQWVFFMNMAENHPHSGRTHWFLGSAYADFGQPDKALESWTRATNLLRGDYIPVSTMAQRLGEIGEKESAMALLASLRRNWSQYTEAKEWIAMTYFNLGELDLAAEVAGGAAEEDSRNIIIYHILATQVSNGGEYAEAARIRRRGLEVGEGGGRWVQWYYLAGDLHRIGDLEDAWVALDSARASSPPESMVPLIDSTEAAWEGEGERISLSDFARISQNPAADRQIEVLGSPSENPSSR